MRKITIIIFTILISFMIVFSACSTTVDCSSQDTKYIKYKYNKESKLCEVSNEIAKDVCGNGIIENGENYCSCDKDVKKTDPKLGCNGKLGDYLEKSCNSEDKCVMIQNDKVVEQIKSLDFKNSDIIISSRVKLNSPFIQNSDDYNKVEINLELFKFLSEQNKISDLKIEDISIENSKGLLLASQDLNKGLSSIGSSIDSIYLGLSDISKYYLKDSIKIKLVVSYTKDYYNSKGEITKTQNKKDTLTSNLGRWEIINPNFFEDK